MGQSLPKTLFDFDQMYAFGNELEIRANGHPSIWCAIFGAADGLMVVSARTLSSHEEDNSSLKIAFGCAFTLLCCGLLALLAGAQRTMQLGGQMGMEVNPSVPLHQRFTGCVDVDRNIEDQYLHRGGIGDDG